MVQLGRDDRFGCVRFALSFVLFSKNHTITPLAVPATAGASTFFIGLIVMLVVEQKAKGRLKGMFGVMFQPTWSNKW